MTSSHALGVSGAFAVMLVLMHLVFNHVTGWTVFWGVYAVCSFGVAAVKR